MSKEDNAVKEEAKAAATESAAEDKELEELEAKVGDANLVEEFPAETQSPKEEAKAEETPPEQPKEEAGAKADDQSQEEVKTEGELAPKSVNRFQKLANENKELKAEIERLKLQEDQLATEQGLLNEVNPETGDYYTVDEVQRLAFANARETQAQNVAAQRYQLEVQQNQQQISAETQAALKEFPIFDQSSKDYNPQLAQLADQRLGRSLIMDENGTLIGSHDSPYEILQTLATAYQAAAEKSKVEGQLEAQKATEKMLANADTPLDAPSKGSGDELDDLFEKVKDVKFA